MNLRLCTAALVFALAASPGLAEDAPLKQPGRWVQDYTARKADPAIVFGSLANGLRYAILHNETPSDGVAMRMLIGSGSMAERDEEQGLAHFLEHMAFRGSTNVPDGEVVHMLERQGLRFGPDTNAATGQESTVYTFTFPKADAAALDTGFTLFREIGERLTLGAPLVEAEKGVVLSEERLRDTPPYRALKAGFGNTLAGTRAVARWPIGTIEAIRAATPERLRRYYRANYRPANATIVVVGKVDPAAVEKDIRARFADWRAAAPGDTVDPGVAVPASPAAEFVAQGVQDQLTVSWVGPIDRRAETEGVDREMLLRRIGLTALNNRLSDRLLKPGSPVAGAQAYAIPSLLGAASLTQIAFAAPPAKWREALDMVVEEQRRLVQDGIQPAELQRALTVMRTEMKSKAASAATRKSPDIADEIVFAASNDVLYTSDAQDLAFAEPILAAVKPGEVDAALRGAFTGKGPVLFRSAQSEPATAAKLQQALADSFQRPLAARAAEAAIVWPYAAFGAPGRIVSRSADRALGATLVRFANGSRLLVKPTPYEKDTIKVTVSFGNGRAGAPAALVRALWAAELFPLGGTGKLSTGQIQQWAQTGGKIVSIKAQVATGAFRLLGATRPADLGAQMQLLAAYARDPGFRSEAADKMRDIGPMIAGQVQANATSVFFRGVQTLAAGGNARFVTVPAAADIAATQAADLPALLRGSLAGPADVAIVGDVTPEAAIRQMQATFGAGKLPPRAAAVPASVTMPEGRAAPWEFLHGGRPDQAFYGEFWQVPDYFSDPGASSAADVLAAVLNARLVDSVREKLGMTYSPMVPSVASMEVRGLGYLGAAIETPQANFGAFHALLAKQVEDLAARPVTPDELARAKQPLIEARRKERENNDFWAANLSLAMRDPRAGPVALGREQAVAAVTAGDVAAFAARFLRGRQAVTIVSRAK